ncbi:hypothetical protein [uncultured Tateyamaria sp.]|uniref:hypothetical protein n=1 Tax=uncultured Tateyamaria sp. TaxID=455651 RepID=UPI0026165D45|nr:hypothetical protein [uncultured Tateyamaria sp.]
MRAAATALLCILAGPALAEWAYLPSWTDPVDGFDTRAATTTNADGATLHLYRNPIGRVYALFTLPDTAGDVVTTGTVMTLTPQGFEPKTVEARAERGRVVEYAISTGRQVRNRLWHGEGQAPAFGTFHDMLEASDIEATFTLTDGTTLDTSWSTQGAATPIAQAIGVSMDGIPAGAEWEETAAQALLAAMTACQFPKLDVMCVQHVTACSTHISDTRDIDGFEACVAD